MTQEHYRPETVVQWLSYRWRQLATGFSFAVFGIAGLVFAPILLPLVRLGGGDKRDVRVRAQWVVSRWFRTFSHLMRLVGVIDWKIDGAEKLTSQGRMIIANHPTLIDVVLLLGYVPQVDCIVKQALFENWFTRAPVTWAGYVSNSTATQLVADCTARLQQGRSLLVFPEGTRTVPGEPMRMANAAARIALQSGAEILPVTITCEPMTLTKGLPWYRVPSRRAQLRLKVGTPYRADSFLNEAPSLTIAARRLSRHWEREFSQGIGIAPRR